MKDFTENQSVMNRRLRIFSNYTKYRAENVSVILEITCAFYM